MYQYILCGLKVESDLALPELTPWPGSPDHPFDVEFRLGSVEQICEPDEKRLRFQASGPDKIIFHIPKAGRVSIEDGRRVIVDPFAGVSDDRLRVEFIGTTQSLLWYERGYLPLHASALLVEGRAIAVGAQSHSGKSVLAAALAKRGCPVVADDMMVVDSSRKAPVVLPGYQKLRLWEDACRELGLLGSMLANAHFVPGKFVLATTAAPPEIPVRLTDMFILSGDRQAKFSAEQLPVVQGLQHLLAATHWLDGARALGRQAQVFSSVNDIVSKVKLWRLTPADGLEHALESADALLELVSS